jgi:spore maturation protein CgeB
MNGPADDIVFLGLTLSSSWGNGHATTYRALLRGLAELGKRVLFLERDVPWYAAHRDLPCPDFCEFRLYESVEDLGRRFGNRIAVADAVIVGSYVPDGIAVLDAVLSGARGLRAFYDIDTPVTLAGLVQGRIDYIARRQIPALGLYLSFSGGPVLQRLHDEFGARRPCALHCAVDAAAYRPIGAAPQWDLGYLGTHSPDRQPVLERLLLTPARLLPDRRFVVAGPQYPNTIDWPANVRRIEHLPPAEHAAFYGAQRFTLNVTRADMVAAGWSPSVRLFEAAACGTAIISDRWPGLHELLPDGEAILIADTQAAVIEALTSMPEERRESLAARARQIVLREHTGTARARQLCRLLEERCAAERPAMLAARAALNGSTERRLGL